jgi:hypothetical protein
MLREDGKFKRPTEWEDWIRELYNDEVRRRRRERKDNAHEILSIEVLEAIGVEFYYEDKRIIDIENGEYTRGIQNSYATPFDREFHFSKRDLEKVKRMRLFFKEEEALLS